MTSGASSTGRAARIVAISRSRNVIGYEYRVLAALGPPGGRRHFLHARAAACTPGTGARKNSRVTPASGRMTVDQRMECVMDTTFAVAPVIGIIDRHRPVTPAPAAARRPAPCPADLRIDGWLVQPSLNLLTRNEACVRLRAQLMDLLLCLASQPGKVFRKEALVAEVWEGRWVAQSALSRCIAELRAALGDDAQHPRVIETITKRGYRLIAEVEVVSSEPAPPLPVALAAASQAAHCRVPGSVEAVPRTFWQRLLLAARRAAV
jgi:DNA-binding winged helix-turn-helix (wHTH) protein